MPAILLASAPYPWGNIIRTISVFTCCQRKEAGVPPNGWAPTLPAKQQLIAINQPLILNLPLINEKCVRRNVRSNAGNQLFRKQFRQFFLQGFSIQVFGNNFSGGI